MAFLNEIYTRIRSCVADANSSPPINNTADRMDADLNDIAGGLNDAILRDGTSTVTADVPWSGKRITGLGPPKVQGDALSAGAFGAMTQSGTVQSDSTGGVNLSFATPFPNGVTAVVGTINAGARSGLSVSFYLSAKTVTGFSGYCTSTSSGVIGALPGIELDWLATGY